MDPTRKHTQDRKAPEDRKGCLLYISRGAPEDQGRSFRLEDHDVTVGRGEECDLVLFDQNVSRRHARFSVCPEGILVEDLGSTNGMTYLGKRIERVTLTLGARICMGECTIDLLPLPESHSIPVSRLSRYGGLVGESLPMRRLYSVLQILERSDAPVLIEGETGTGKEMVARALHQKSSRADKPLLLIDCANVPLQLMESELFGYLKGAFTGAVSDRAGAFEVADGGTVFLDELGELPLALQPKLLRVLETGQVKRLGATGHVSVDVRIIAATKKSLAAEVAERRFRDDLYYRVAVVQVTIPPLRERPEDIPVLARHLLEKISSGSMEALPQQTMEQLMHHQWPGNVRELRNVLMRLLALQVPLGRDLPDVISWPSLGDSSLSPRGSTKPSDSPDSTLGDFRLEREKAISSFEQAYLARLWRENSANLSASSRAAGIDRKYLRKLLRKYGIV